MALAVSIVALGLSAWGTIRSARSIMEQVDATRNDMKTATFQRIHETLIAPDAARGRRLLFRAHANQDYPDLSDERWDRINYSLALYDTLGGYLKRGEVPSEAVLTAWRLPLQNISEPIEGFQVFKSSHNIDQPWESLAYLVAQAKSKPNILEGP